MANKTRKERESYAAFRRIIEYDKIISYGSYPSVKRFKDEFGISEATVHRDLDVLRNDFGAFDCLKYDRNKGGYYYSNPTFRIPAMLSTEKQIIAAKLMTNLLELIRGTPVYNQAVEVFASLSENLDDDAKLDAKKLSNRILFLGMTPVKVEDEIWAKLEEAMVKNNYVSFDYLDYEVKVQPWQLIYSNGMWSLYAYNQNEKIRDIRFYNLPYIRNLEIDKDNTFELPDDFEYTKRAKGNFRRYIGPELLHCKLKITSEKTLSYIKTYKWADDQKFEKQPDGSTIMTFTSNQDWPIFGWVMSHGMYVQPLEPEWLVNEWQKNVKEMARLANGV